MKKLTVEKLEDAVVYDDKIWNLIEVSAIVNNKKVTIKFLGYTVMQAVRKFKQLNNINE